MKGKSYLEYTGGGLLKHIEKYRKKFEELQTLGMTIDGIKNEKLNIVKFEDIELLGRNKFQGVIYSLKEPARINEKRKNNLIVVFSSYADAHKLFAVERYLGPENNNLYKSVPANTYFLYIGDSTGLTGSYYLNSPLNPDFENQVEKLINQTAIDLQVSLADIVMIGNSRGGFASIYYAIRGGSKSVSADPILNRTLFEHPEKQVGDSGTQAVFGIIPYDLVEVINQTIVEFRPIVNNFVVLSTEDSILAAQFIKKVRGITIKWLDLGTVGRSLSELHGNFIKDSLPYQNSIVNSFLMKNDDISESVTMEDENFLKKFQNYFDVVPPSSSLYWDIKWNSLGLLLHRNKNLIRHASWLNFKLYEIMYANYTYKVVIECDYVVSELKLFVWQSNKELKIFEPVWKGMEAIFIINYSVDITYLRITGTWFKSEDQFTIVRFSIEGLNY